MKRGMMYLTDGLENERIYLQPAKMMLNAVNDIVELQKAEVTYSDIPHGKLHFLVEMYGFAWEYRFTVTDIDGSCSRVVLDISGEAANKARKIRRQFALLDSMLIDTVRTEQIDSDR
jgi:hypothetical protein